MPRMTSTRAPLAAAAFVSSLQASAGCAATSGRAEPAEISAAGDAPMLELWSCKHWYHPISTFALVRSSRIRHHLICRQRTDKMLVPGCRVSALIMAGPSRIDEHWHFLREASDHSVQYSTTAVLSNYQSFQSMVGTQKEIRTLHSTICDDAGCASVEAPSWTERLGDDW